MSAFENLRYMAYLNWCGRGRPFHDELTDWFHAERLRKQRIREAAYFHWIARGLPIRDDWEDWFWAEKLDDGMPEITRFSPTAGRIGTKVTITGKYLQKVDRVAFNQAPANFQKDSDTQVSVVVPANASDGPIRVQILQAISFSSSSSFDVLTPEIASFNPTAGRIGAKVTITGKNFQEVDGVSFGVTKAEVRRDSDTQLSTFVPPNASDGPLSVQIQGRPFFSAARFSVLADPPPPSISLTPTSMSMTIERGNSAPSTVNVNWKGFSDPLDFAFSGASIPPGVSLIPSNGTLTPANPRINVTISVENNASSDKTDIWLTVKRAGGTPSATGSLTLTVVPKAGNFVFRQAPAVPQATRILSPDGKFQAVVTRQGTTRFYSVEFSSNSGEVIAVIPFEVQGGQLGGSGGSSIAGVLFSHAIPTTTAAVISYDPVSVEPPPRHKLTTLVLTDPRRGRTTLIDQFSYRFGYMPQIGFSPDGSVIAVVGATINPAITSIATSGGIALFVDAQTPSLASFSFSDPTTPVSASIAADRRVTFSTPAGGSQSKPLR